MLRLCNNLRARASKSSLQYQNLFWLFMGVVSCRYSDWLRAGRPTGRSSIPNKAKNFLFSTSFGPILSPIQQPTQYVPRHFPRRQSGRGVNLTTHFQLVPRPRKRDLFIHSLIRLHGVVLNFLSTRGTLLFLYGGYLYLIPLRSENYTRHF
jgi:hypothetical protein